MCYAESREINNVLIDKTQWIVNTKVMKTAELRLSEFRQGVKLLRAAQGWTQPDLAKMCGLSAGQISYIETGNRNATFEQQWEISEAFGLQPEDVYAAGREGHHEGELAVTNPVQRTLLNSINGLSITERALLIKVLDLYRKGEPHGPALHHLIDALAVMSEGNNEGDNEKDN